MRIEAKLFFRKKNFQWICLHAFAGHLAACVMCLKLYQMLVGDHHPIIIHHPKSEQMTMMTEKEIGNISLQTAVAHTQNNKVINMNRRLADCPFLLRCNIFIVPSVHECNHRFSLFVWLCWPPYVVPKNQMKKRKKKKMKPMMAVLSGWFFLYKNVSYNSKKKKRMRYRICIRCMAQMHCSAFEFHLCLQNK